MTEENQPKTNPIVAFATLVIIGLAILAYTQREEWFGIEATVANVEPAPVAEAPKVEEPAKAEEAAKAPEPAKVEEAAKAPETVAVAEPAKVPEAAPAKELAIPTFDTVRVEPSGDAIVAGRAEPGAEVSITHKNTTASTMDGSTTANADGAFVVITDKPLPEGQGTLTIAAKSNDKVMVSQETVAVDVKPKDGGTPLVAVLRPDAPTKIVQAPAAAPAAEAPSAEAPSAEAPAAAAQPAAVAAVNLDTVDYDDAGNIVFGGRGPADGKVQVYVDNGLFGATDIGDAGTWTIASKAPLAVGNHELRADEIGPDGTVRSRVAMPFFREDPAKVLAAKQPETPTVVAAAEPAPATTTVTEVVKTPEPAPVAAAPKVAEAPKVEEAPAEATAPAETAVAAATPEPPAPTTIVIQPGNNLWKLSRQLYGKGIQYTVIYEANKDQIKNPHWIYPGQVLVTPDAPAVQ